MRFLTLLALIITGCSQPGPAVEESPTTAGPVMPGPTPADTTEGPATAGPVFAGPMTADPIYDAPTLVAAMAGAYPDWYRTLSFTQRTSRRTASGIAVETWREWAALPGRLRIEMGGPFEGADALFVGDSTYLYRDGELAAVRAERNPLLLWGFDVYTQPAAETLHVLETQGYDLGAFRTDALDRRLMYVLGTPETGEVWVEQDRLLFMRLVEPSASGALQDVRFENYQPLGGGWIAPYVAVFEGDQLVFWETYSDVVAGPPLDPVLFAPRRWAEGVEAGR